MNMHHSNNADSLHGEFASNQDKRFFLLSYPNRKIVIKRANKKYNTRIMFDSADTCVSGHSTCLKLEFDPSSG
jgi:hypothetical protein